MEEVLNKLESAVIGGESKSNFEDLYKNWGRLGGQEERRKEILETQKSNRHTKLDAFRGILGLVNIVEESNIFQSTKKVYYRPNIYVAGFNRASPTYSNVLMISEWMIEKPTDLQDEWYVVPCPKGIRLLVIANRGTTKCYTKFGKYRSQMRTALPGGSRYNSRNNRHTCCVLDCFYNENNSTMYVLDFLAWNNQPMTECDTEFRYFWLKSQFDEIPELSKISKFNEMKFALLPKVPCTPQELDKFMMTYPHFDDGTSMDGLLFYHKKAHYVSGQTPLVVWLYPYMVQEVLGKDITVHDSYLKQKPEGYVNQLEFIKDFEENMAKKKSRSRRTSTRDSMDTADSQDVSDNKEMEADEVEEQMEPVDEDKSDEVDQKGSEKVDEKADVA